MSRPILSGRTALACTAMVSDRAAYVLPRVCSPAIQRQDRVLLAGSPSSRWRMRKAALKAQGRRKVKIQLGGEPHAVIVQPALLDNLPRPVVEVVHPRSPYDRHGVGAPKAESSGQAGLIVGDVAALVRSDRWPGLQGALEVA